MNSYEFFTKPTALGYFRHLRVSARAWPFKLANRVCQ